LNISSIVVIVFESIKIIEAFYYVIFLNEFGQQI